MIRAMSKPLPLPTESVIEEVRLKVALVTENNVPPIPAMPDERYDLNILHSIRRIIRASDMHSKDLASNHNITAPQLITLHNIALRPKTTINELSKLVSLDASTLVGIIDRLEAKGYVTRARSTEDRRQVSIQITEAGRAFLVAAPSPLQSSLAKALTRLTALEQSIIAQSLERIVQMIDEDNDEN